MTTKIEGTSGVEFPDATVQGSAAVVDGPAFRATQSGAQGLTDSVDTIIIFDTEVFDTNNAYFANRFTPQVEGYYQITGYVSIVPTANANYVSIRKNGTEFARGSQTQGGVLSGYLASCLVEMNGTTDYVEISFFQNSGAPGVTNPGLSHFSGFLARKA